MHDHFEFPEKQFSVEIIGSSATSSGKIVYVEGGKYQVDYTLMKAGEYKVHIRTGGTDIFCGRGEEMKCSPFHLDVEPGIALAKVCEAESLNPNPDSLIEARARETGVITVQAKDRFGNNRKIGGDNFMANFRSLDNENIMYRGYVRDNEDGTYEISYSIPIAGLYQTEVTLDGKRINHCISASEPFLFDRNYDRLNVYKSPEFCGKNNITLTVIHNTLRAFSSTANEEA